MQCTKFKNKEYIYKQSVICPFLIKTLNNFQPVMHLSISCPNPGEYRGFDKSSCQMPHPWGQVGCQIPTLSPALVGDLTAQVLHCCNYKQQRV